MIRTTIGRDIVPWLSEELISVLDIWYGEAGMRNHRFITMLFIEDIRHGKMQGYPILLNPMSSPIPYLSNQDTLEELLEEVGTHVIPVQEIPETIEEHILLLCGILFSETGGRDPIAVESIEHLYANTSRSFLRETENDPYLILAMIKKDGVRYTLKNTTLLTHKTYETLRDVCSGVFGDVILN